MNSVKLSIITVNLNNLEGLKKTYESVVCQTFTDYEWLVIDGGSTDGSREFIEQHQDKFAYWCSEPDKGIYNAMNKGIIRAKGEYLNFMNSGDSFVCEDTLEGVFGKERDKDILFGYVMEGEANGVCCEKWLMKKTINWYDFFSHSLPHQGTFIKSILFSEIGLYDENCRIVSDWKWFVEALFNFDVSYEFIPNKIAVFQKGGLSYSTDCLSERARQRKMLFPKYIRETDIQNLTKMSSIQSSKLAMFFFKLASTIAWRTERLKHRYKR